MKKKISLWLLPLLLCLPLFLNADEDTSEKPKRESFLHEKPSEVPERISAKSEISDEEIGRRIEEIMRSTGWFTDPKVTVHKGVVFLYGETKNQQFKDWAGNLARNTQDVTAVVNKIVVLMPSVWDFHMVIHELMAQTHKFIRSLPAIVFGCIILFLSWILARLVYKLVPYIFRDKMNTSLLHEVIARAISIFVFTLGVYFIFEMADLTTMAVTILSGTGLVGIIVGIAFRDITENFLASILLSLQNPFHAGDLIDIIAPTSGYTVTGYVERLTLRVTILVMMDGNHLQIPNATVYKSNIRNYTSNPNRREDFIIPIGSNCSLSKAVETALKVLVENEVILKDPEPLVLVDSLVKDSVNLHIYYWINIRKYNWLKIKSSVIRLIKQAFQTEGIDYKQELQTSKTEEKHPKESSQTTSEAHSSSDVKKEKIEGLSSQSRPPEGGDNLLNPKQNKKDKEDKKK
jgi:small conductance mechanosensitive channel